MINDNAEKIRGMLVDALEGTEHLLKHYPNGFISSDIESVGSFINSALSLLPKPCEKCGGSGEKLTSGFCNMIHKYIPCPACSQAPAVEELIKDLKKYSQANITTLKLRLWRLKSDEACTHLTEQAKQIAQLKDGAFVACEEAQARNDQIAQLEGEKKELKKLLWDCHYIILNNPKDAAELIVEKLNPKALKRRPDQALQESEAEE